MVPLGPQQNLLRRHRGLSARSGMRSGTTTKYAMFIAAARRWPPMPTN